MNIIIHRGANQIGGCITEISTSKAKIIVDLGSNLPGCQKPDFTISQINQIVEGSNAIFYTHYHADHVGFCSIVTKEIPQYIGFGAKEILQCKFETLDKHEDHQSDLEAVKNMRTYEAAIPILMGDLRVTPYYCSHSAFDAYMLKIEWEDKVILHTGDFRKHGYLGGKLIPMLKRHVGQVDVLITEGTMLSRNTEAVRTENEIKQLTKAALRKHKYAFALGSSTDCDRLASFHAACDTTNRHFLVDKYQKSVLDIFTKYTTSPLFDFSNHGRLEESTFAIESLQGWTNPKIVNEMKRRGFLMPIRCKSEWLVKMMLGIYTEEEPILLYSMWDGYWKGNEEQRIPEVLAIRSLFKPENIIPMHTSGHADVETLAEVCKTVDPRLAIIPIHKDKDTDYCSLPISEYHKSKVITTSAVVDDITIDIR